MPSKDKAVAYKFYADMHPRGLKKLLSWMNKGGGDRHITVKGDEIGWYDGDEFVVWCKAPCWIVALNWQFYPCDEGLFSAIDGSARAVAQ